MQIRHARYNLALALLTRAIRHFPLVIGHCSLVILLTLAAPRARGDAQSDYDRTWLPREKRAVTPAERGKLADDLLAAVNRTLEKDKKKEKKKVALAEQQGQLESLAGASRQEVLLLCTKAYDIGSRQREGYAPAARALGILQILEPDRRLDSLQKLYKMYEDVYQLAPSKNLGISKGFAEVNLQLGEEEWFLLRAKQAAGKVPPADQTATIRAISTNYAKGLDVVRSAMSAIRPYAAGNKGYSEFLKSAEEVEKDLIESQKRIAGPLAAAAQNEQNLRNQAVFQNRLKTNPADKFAADRLVRLYINELDDPAQVASVLKGASPEVQQVVSLLKKPVEKLTPEQALTVVQWCEKSNDNPASPNRVAMDVRLRVYGAAYERVAKTHDADFQKVDAALKQAGADLAREHMDEEKVRSLAAAYVEALQPPVVVAAVPTEAPRATAPENPPAPTDVAPEKPSAASAVETAPEPERPLASVKVEPAAQPEPAPERSSSNSSIFDFGQD